MKRLLGALIVVIMLLTALTSCGLDVPKPEIKSAEFDFSVTYEIDGVQNTVSGVYVCEYKGLGWALDGGYYRDWDGYVKDNTVEEIIVLCQVEEFATLDLHLGFYPDYLMNDPSLYWDRTCAPYLSVCYDDEEGLSFDSDADRIYEQYNARIVSFYYEEPIKNSFSPTNF